MGRILGIDYGSKRVGIAETDDLKIIASPLITVHSKDVVSFIDDYAQKHNLELIVVGVPQNLNTQSTHGTKVVESFLNLLKKKLPQIPVELEDERFTSKMASQAMIMGGVKKSKRAEKGNLDKVSASIILQSYLDRTSKGF